MISEDSTDHYAWDHFGEGLQYASLILGIVLAIFGIWKLVKTWQKARDEAIVARSDQQKMLEQITKEFHPNGGSSMVDRQKRIEAAVNTQAESQERVEQTLDTHTKEAASWFAANDQAHEQIHRRIDGIFELMAGSHANDPRKLKAKHKGRCPQSEEDL